MLTHLATEDVDLGPHVLRDIDDSSRWLLGGDGGHATLLLLLTYQWITGPCVSQHVGDWEGG